VLQGRTEGLVYWVGALIVVGSFMFVDREEVKDEIEVDGAVDGVVVEGDEFERGESESYAADGDFDSRSDDLHR